MPFWSTMRKIGWNIVQWNVDHYTIVGTLMIHLFYVTQQNISNVFYSYLNSRHLNISLTIENEKDNRMSLLDVNIIREKEKFTTSVYRKPTFSGIYTHFDSLLPSSNKIGFLHTLLYKFFRICSDWTKFHLELVKLTDVFKNNGYPENLLIIVLKCFWIANIEYKKK